MTAAPPVVLLPNVYDLLPLLLVNTVVYCVALVVSVIVELPVVLKVIVPDEYVPPLGDTAPLLAGPAIVHAVMAAPLPVLSLVVKVPMLTPLR